MNNKNLFNHVEKNDIVIKHSFYKNVFKTAFKNPAFLISLILLSTIFIIGLCFSLIYDIDVSSNIDFNNSFISPNSTYPFGTNEFGQNMFHIIFIATFNTIKLAIIATFLNVLVGLIMGILWGNSNKFNSIMIFIKGILDSIPKTFLFIIFIFALGNNFISLLIVIIFFNWINIACLVRNNLISLRNKDYNVVSKLNRTPLFKIAIHNYLPALLPIIFNSIAISIPEIIAFEITIHCFGFSIIDNNLSLGNILYSSISKNIYFAFPYLFFIPLTILFIINICFFNIGKTLSSLSIKEGDK